MARFFVDDDTTEGEENGSGFLDNIRIHDTVITPATPVPEPPFYSTTQSSREVPTGKSISPASNSMVSINSVSPAPRGR